jgi:ubiquinone/menaquinone biosynthesis C-methylase UbiE
LKELEDYPRFPSLLRNYQAAFIGFAAVKLRLYSPLISHMKTMHISCGEMIDLCSGSGAPAIDFFRKTNCFGRLVLTDKYPFPFPGNDKRITYKVESADVLKIDFQSRKCYTMFNAFHHFSDAEKLLIARRIVKAGAFGFFAEILEPDITSFLKVIFAATIGTLLMSPFIKPFSFRRLFFTYIIPVNILTIAYDGIISVFKSRTAKDYKKLFAGFQNEIDVLQLRNNFQGVILIRIQPGSHEKH